VFQINPMRLSDRGQMWGWWRASLCLWPVTNPHKNPNNGLILQAENLKIDGLWITLLLFFPAQLRKKSTRILGIPNILSTKFPSQRGFFSWNSENNYDGGEDKWK
jgi:hypothetical protein